MNLKCLLLPMLLAGSVLVAQNTTDEILENITRANTYWQTNNSTNVRSFWDNAAYHTGNMEAYFITGNQDYIDYSTAWAEYNNWMGATGTDKSRWTYSYDESANGVMFGDWQICFQTYIDLYNINPSQDKVARAYEVFDYQMSTSNDDYWWWADGLYMVMPVMVKMYKLSDNNMYLDKLYQWFKYAKELMYDGPGGIPCDSEGYTTSASLKSGAEYADSTNYAYLFYRDANYVYPKSDINGLKNFWARGDGWVFAGLAKVLKDYPASYPHYSEFAQTYTEMASAIIASQQQDDAGNGFWTQSMIANYPLSGENPYGYETSGTAFFTYGLFWGINNGFLDSATYYAPALRAWNYLSTVALQSTGKIGYVQPIGAQATQATPRSTTQNFGVGAFLLAASEYYRFVERHSVGTATKVFSLTQSLSFTTDDTQKSFLLKGYNLQDAVTITAPAGITLSKTSIARNAITTDGILITATYDGQTIINDSIRFFSAGAPAAGIAVEGDPQEILNMPQGMFLHFDQSINPRAVVLAGYTFPDGVRFSASEGLSLSVDSMTQQQVTAGDTLWVTWDGETLLEAGSVKLENKLDTGNIDVFAAPNIISTWDGDNATGAGSKLTAFGWDVTAADGVTPAEATYNEYGVAAGIRYLPPWEQYEYNGFQWKGERIAFIRWNQRDDVFNFPVYLTQGDYKFRGLLTWNTNGTAPVTFNVGFNTGKANTGTMLGQMSNTFNEGFKLADYQFDITVAEEDTFYLTFQANQGRDVICGVAMLSIYSENIPSTNLSDNSMPDNCLHAYANNEILYVTGLQLNETINVYDVTGTLVASAQANGSNCSFSMPHKGLYVLVCKAGTDTQVRKIMVK